MGIFGRKQSNAGPSASGPTIEFHESDIPELEAVLDGFRRAVGTSALEVVAQRIARHGRIDVDRDDMGISALGPDAADRPWQWLELGARCATSNGRDDLVIKASGVVGFWQMAIAPNLGPADWFAMGLGGCPGPTEAAIHRMALDPTISIADDVVLATDKNGDSMTVGYVRAAARRRLEAISL